MTLEELKKLLKSGAITQEQFDEMAKALGFEQDPEPKDPAADPEPLDYDKLDRIIQARVDIQMTAERKKSADLKNKLDRLQKEKLTDDELRQIEIDEKEKAIADRKKRLQIRKTDFLQ